MKEIKNLTHLETIAKNNLSIVIAKTHSCSTCKMIIEHLTKTIPRLNDVDTYQVFVDDLDEVRGRLVIFSVPTVLVFSNGKEILRESRFINTHKINRLLDNFLN